MAIPEENGFMNKKSQYPKDKKLVFHKMFGGLHWRFINNRSDNLSIICHDGSYGHEKGLFEICPSWTDEETKNWEDSVKGYCDFAEVQKWVDKLYAKEVIPNSS